MPREEINDLIEKQGTAYHNMRSLLDKAAEQKRDLSPEEEKQYESWENEYDSYEEKIASSQREFDRAKRLDERRSKLEKIRETPAGRPTPEKSKDSDEEVLRRSAIRNYLHGGLRALGQDELRAIQADSDPDGGYGVPQTFVTELIQAIKDNTFMREICTVLPPIDAGSYGAPTLDTDLNDADWTPEIATVAEDTALKIGKRELTPHQLAKRVKVSRKLLRISALNTEALVLDRLGYKFAITEEKQFLTADGAGKPLGLFTQSSQGIDSTRYVNTGNTATAVVADNLFDVFFSLKEGYSKDGRWLLSRPLLKMIRKLKDSQNQYLWEKGFAGAPSTILDRPYHVSEYVPQTFTTGKAVGAFGNFKYYWIGESLQMTVQRLDELYAENNQVGFIGRKEIDGAPVLAEAFAIIQLG